MCDVRCHLKALVLRWDYCGNRILVRDLSSGCAEKVSHQNASPALLSCLLFFLLQDLFVLLDLIGAPSPHFGNQFPSTTPWLSRLQNIGKTIQYLEMNGVTWGFFTLLKVCHKNL